MLTAEDPPGLMQEAFNEFLNLPGSNSRISDLLRSFLRQTTHHLGTSLEGRSEDNVQDVVRRLEHAVRGIFAVGELVWLGVPSKESFHMMSTVIDCCYDQIMRSLTERLRGELAQSEKGASIRNLGRLGATLQLSVQLLTLFKSRFLEAEAMCASRVSAAVRPPTAVRTSSNSLRLDAIDVLCVQYTMMSEFCSDLAAYSNLLSCEIDLGGASIEQWDALKAQFETAADCVVGLLGLFCGEGEADGSGSKGLDATRGDMEIAKARRLCSLLESQMAEALTQLIGSNTDIEVCFEVLQIVRGSFSGSSRTVAKIDELVILSLHRLRDEIQKEADRFYTTTHGVGSDAIVDEGAQVSCIQKVCWARRLLGGVRRTAESVLKSCGTEIDHSEVKSITSLVECLMKDVRSFEDSCVQDWRVSAEATIMRGLKSSVFKMCEAKLSASVDVAAASSSIAGAHDGIRSVGGATTKSLSTQKSGSRSLTESSSTGGGGLRSGHMSSLARSTAANVLRVNFPAAAVGCLSEVRTAIGLGIEVGPILLTYALQQSKLKADAELLAKVAQEFNGSTHGLSAEMRVMYCAHLGHINEVADQGCREVNWLTVSLHDYARNLKRSLESFSSLRRQVNEIMSSVEAAISSIGSTRLIDDAALVSVNSESVVGGEGSDSSDHSSSCHVHDVCEAVEKARVIRLAQIVALYETIPSLLKRVEELTMHSFSEADRSRMRPVYASCARKVSNSVSRMIISALAHVQCLFAFDVKQPIWLCGGRYGTLGLAILGTESALERGCCIGSLIERAEDLPSAVDQASLRGRPRIRIRVAFSPPDSIVPEVSQAFKAISSLVSNIILSSMSFVRWIDGTCRRLPIRPVLQSATGSGAGIDASPRIGEINGSDSPTISAVGKDGRSDDHLAESSGADGAPDDLGRGSTSMLINSTTRSQHAADAEAAAEWDEASLKDTHFTFYDEVSTNNVVIRLSLAIQNDLQRTFHVLERAGRAWRRVAGHCDPWHAAKLRRSALEQLLVDHCRIEPALVHVVSLRSMSSPVGGLTSKASGPSEVVTPERIATQGAIRSVDDPSLEVNESSLVSSMALIQQSSSWLARGLHSFETVQRRLLTTTHFQQLHFLEADCSLVVEMMVAQISEVVKQLRTCAERIVHHRAAAASGCVTQLLNSFTDVGEISIDETSGSFASVRKLLHLIDNFGATEADMDEYLLGASQLWEAAVRGDLNAGQETLELKDNQSKLDSSLEQATELWKTTQARSTSIHRDLARLRTALSLKLREQVSGTIEATKSAYSTLLDCIGRGFSAVSDEAMISLSAVRQACSELNAHESTYASYRELWWIDVDEAESYRHDLELKSMFQLSHELAPLCSIHGELSKKVGETSVVVWSVLNNNDFATFLGDLRIRLASHEGPQGTLASIEAVAVQKALKDLVKSYMEGIELLKELKAASLGERQFASLLTDLRSKVPAGRTMHGISQSTMTVGQFFSLRPVDAGCHIRKTCEKAALETRLVSEVSEMTHFWAVTTFSMHSDRSRNVVFMRLPTDTQSRLVADLTRVQSLVSLDPIPELSVTTRKLRDTLSSIQSTVALLSLVETRATALLSVFSGNSSVRLRLPEESRLFDETMKRVVAFADTASDSFSSSVSTVCCLSSTQSELGQILSQFETLQVHLTDVLDARRQKCSRLWFLSDEELLSLSSIHAGSNTERLCVKLFPGAVRFVTPASESASKEVGSPRAGDPTSHHPTSSLSGGHHQFRLTHTYGPILGLQTKDETLNFRESVGVTENAETWIDGSAFEMKSASRLDCKQALCSYVALVPNIEGGGFSPIPVTRLEDGLQSLVNECSYSSLFAAVAVWFDWSLSKAKTSLVDSDGPTLRDLEQSYAALYQTAVSLVTKNPSAAHRKKLRNLVIQFSDCLLHIADSAKSDAESLGGSGWAFTSRLRHVWAASTDDLALQNELSLFPYQHELSGIPNRLPLCPASARFGVAFIRNLALMHSGCAVASMDSGAPNLIADLAYSLGTHCYTLRVHDMRSLASAQSSICGALSQGFWLVLNTDAKTSEGVFSRMAALAKYVADTLRAGQREVTVFNRGLRIRSSTIMILNMDTDCTDASSLKSLVTSLQSVFRPTRIMSAFSEHVVDVLLASRGFSSHAELAGRLFAFQSEVHNILKDSTVRLGGLGNLMEVIHQASARLRAISSVSGNLLHVESSLISATLLETVIPRLSELQKVNVEAVAKSIFGSGNEQCSGSLPSDSDKNVRSKLLDDVLPSIDIGPNTPQSSEYFSWYVSTIHAAFLSSKQILLYGDPGVGKSSVLRVYSAFVVSHHKTAVTRVDVSPSVFSYEELFGRVDERTGMFVDGIVSRLLRQSPSTTSCARHCDAPRILIHVDGCLSGDVAAAFASLVSFKRSIRLASGETLELPPDTLVVFETTSVESMSQAFLSDCTVIRVHPREIPAETRVQYAVTELLKFAKLTDVDTHSSDLTENLSTVLRMVLKAAQAVHQLDQEHAFPWTEWEYVLQSVLRSTLVLVSGFLRNQVEPESMHWLFNTVLSCAVQSCVSLVRFERHIDSLSLEVTQGIRSLPAAVSVYYEGIAAKSVESSPSLNRVNLLRLWFDPVKRSWEPLVAPNSIAVELSECANMYIPGEVDRRLGWLVQCAARSDSPLCVIGTKCSGRSSALRYANGGVSGELWKVTPVWTANKMYERVVSSLKSKTKKGIASRLEGALSSSVAAASSSGTGVTQRWFFLDDVDCTYAPETCQSITISTLEYVCRANQLPLAFAGEMVDNRAARFAASIDEASGMQCSRRLLSSGVVLRMPEVQSSNVFSVTCARFGSSVSQSVSHSIASCLFQSLSTSEPKASNAISVSPHSVSINLHSVSNVCGLVKRMSLVGGVACDDSMIVESLLPSCLSLTLVSDCCSISNGAIVKPSILLFPKGAASGDDRLVTIEQAVELVKDAAEQYTSDHGFWSSIVTSEEFVLHSISAMNALAEKGSMLCISGPAGSGKRTLAEFASHCAGLEVVKFMDGVSETENTFDQGFLSLANHLSDGPIVLIVDHLPKQCERLIDAIESVYSGSLDDLGLSIKTREEICSTLGASLSDEEQQSVPSDPWKLVFDRIREGLRVVFVVTPGSEFEATLATQHVSLLAQATSIRLVCSMSMMCTDLTKMAAQSVGIESHSWAAKCNLSDALSSVHKLQSDTMAPLELSNPAVMDVVNVATAELHALSKLQDASNKSLTDLRTSQNRLCLSASTLECEIMQLEEAFVENALLVCRLAGEMEALSQRIATEVDDTQKLESELIASQESITSDRGKAQSEFLAVSGRLAAAAKSVSDMTEDDVRQIQYAQHVTTPLQVIYKCIYLLQNSEEKLDAASIQWTQAKRMIRWSDFIPLVIRSSSTDTPSSSTGAPSSSTGTLSLHCRRQLEQILSSASASSPAGSPSASPAQEAGAGLSVDGTHLAESPMDRFLSWARLLVEYFDGRESLQRKVAQLSDAESELAKRRQSLEVNCSKVEESRHLFEIFESQFSSAMSKAAEYSENQGKSEQLLSRTLEAIGSLETVTTKINQDLVSESQRQTELVRNCAASGLLSSCSVMMSPQERTDYAARLQSSSCVFSEAMPPSVWLWSQSELLRWVSQGLPCDSYTLTGMGIVLKSGRWPLCIDPHGRVKHWLKRHYGQQSLLVKSLCGEYRQTLELALLYGRPIVLEDFGDEYLQNDICDLIRRKVVMSLAGTPELQIGDLNIELKDGFRLILVASATPRLVSPLVTEWLSVVDFSMSVPEISGVCDDCVRYPSDGNTHWTYCPAPKARGQIDALEELAARSLSELVACAEKADSQANGPGDVSRKASEFIRVRSQVDDCIVSLQDCMRVLREGKPSSRIYVAFSRILQVLATESCTFADYGCPTPLPLDSMTRYLRSVARMQPSGTAHDQAMIDAFLEFAFSCSPCMTRRLLSQAASDLRYVGRIEQKHFDIQCSVIKAVDGRIPVLFIGAPDVNAALRVKALFRATVGDKALPSVVLKLAAMDDSAIRKSIEASSSKPQWLIFEISGCRLGALNLLLDVTESTGNLHKDFRLCLVASEGSSVVPTRLWTRCVPIYLDNYASWPSSLSMSIAVAECFRQEQGTKEAIDTNEAVQVACLVHSAGFFSNSEGTGVPSSSTRLLSDFDFSFVVALLYKQTVLTSDLCDVLESTVSIQESSCGVRESVGRMTKLLAQLNLPVQAGMSGLKDAMTLLPTSLANHISASNP